MRHLIYDNTWVQYLDKSINKVMFTPECGDEMHQMLQQIQIP